MTERRISGSHFASCLEGVRLRIPLRAEERLSLPRRCLEMALEYAGTQSIVRSDDRLLPRRQARAHGTSHGDRTGRGWHVGRLGWNRSRCGGDSHLVAASRVLTSRAGDDGGRGCDQGARWDRNYVPASAALLLAEGRKPTSCCSATRPRMSKRSWRRSRRGDVSSSPP